MNAHDRPNILLIFTDMQRFDTIRALGNRVIATPSLDRLAAQGTAFTHAWTPSPVCVSARYAMHYGVWPTRSGIIRNMAMTPDDGTSHASRLAAVGYRTQAIGKLHFNAATEKRGFAGRETQEEIVRTPGEDDYLTWLQTKGFDHVTDPHGVRGEMYYVPQVAQMPAGLHPTHWIGDRSCAFIEANRDAGPWYLMSSFIHPHPPCAPPAPWHKLYRAPLMPPPMIPADRESHLTRTNRIQNRYKYRDQGLDLNLLRCLKAAYYATISFVDLQVGRILDSLEETGQLERTVVVFTSDHGEYLGDYGSFGKRSMHDASSRVPMLVRWPGAPAGRRCDRPASLVDVAATFAAAGHTATDGLDGVDLGALASGAVDRAWVPIQHDTGALGEYALAATDWKYFWSAADRREYLYDKRRDPHETKLCGTTFHRQALTWAGGQLRDFLRGQGSDAVDGDGAWRLFDRPVDVSETPDEGLLIQDHPWADQNLPGYTDLAATPVPG